MTHQQFINTWNWQRNDNDGFPKGYEYQCTDIVYLYSKEVWGIPDGELFPVVGAVDLLNKKSDYFKIIKNNLNDIEQIPSQGDIIVFAGTSGNSFGHVGIVDYADQKKVIVFEQNAGGGGGKGLGGDACQKREHSYWASGGFGQVEGWIKLIKNNNNMSKENAIGQVRDTVLITNPNRKQAIINAVNGDDWNYVVWEFLNECREKQDEIIQKNTLLEEARKELGDCQNQIPCEAGVVETLQAKDKEIEELKKQLEQKPQAVSLEEIEKLISKPKITFDWNEVKIGLAKYAWMQSLVGVAITAGVAWIINYIPELATYKQDIIDWLFTLIGISAVGQNGKQIIKGFNS